MRAHFKPPQRPDASQFPNHATIHVLATVMRYIFDAMPISVERLWRVNRGVE